MTHHTPLQINRQLFAGCLSDNAMPSCHNNQQKAGSSPACLLSLFAVINYTDQTQTKQPTTTETSSVSDVMIAPDLHTPCCIPTAAERAECSRVAAIAHAHPSSTTMHNNIMYCCSCTHSIVQQMLTSVDHRLHLVSNGAVANTNNSGQTANLRSACK
jgi:hypothetical protein